MTKFNRILGVGNKIATANNVGIMLLDNFNSSHLTGSKFFTNKTTGDTDIFVSYRETGLLAEGSKLSQVMTMIGLRYSFELYQHTTHSSYVKPWIEIIYRLVFSERLNDHIDLIIIKENHYDQMREIHKAIYAHHREEYSQLNKETRNQIINTAMLATIKYGTQYVTERLDTIIFLEKLKEEYK